MKDTKQTDQESQLTAQDTGIVMPAVSPKQAVAAWKEYQDLKKSIAMPEDIQSIQGKEFYKKSYWRKVATFFNLSVEITEERMETIGENNFVYHFTQKATAPNGRFAYGTGSCDRMEKGRPNTIHNTRTTAETRAFNRAVSNLVGGGEVSAEEVDSDQVSDSQPAKHAGWTDEEIKTVEMTCANCNAKITDKVSAYSSRRYGKPLCFDCQKREQV